MGVGDGVGIVTGVVIDGMGSDVAGVVGSVLGGGIVDFFLYKLSLLPEPQYSPGLPEHVILHWVTAVKAEPTPRVFPHQHSRLLTVG